jgi:N-acetylglucosaminyldiphosphoundecaprenol N-acetyl-beta-D-mannosaminyltransferase
MLALAASHVAPATVGGFDAHLMIPTQQILGLRFFNGDVDEAVGFMERHGGYLVAPSGTCFARLREDEPYRSAMLSADLAIADSGLMVLTWRLLRRERVQRISGLKYLKQLLARLEREGSARVFWILPGTRARQKLLDCFRSEAFAVKIEDCYIAPRYGLEVDDRHLLGRIEKDRPAHVVIAIGSGPQEKLGHYLCENLSYRPAIHCTGAALGFITGEQVAIPDWADRFFLGWLLRLMAQPDRFIPRLIRGFELPWLIARYGNALPPLRSRNQKSEFPPSPKLRRDSQ